ncbi:hypothetical protein AB0H43_26570 [Hamadaea sp. NPDC050747]|uniref:hypothetical protein n=1 Tax=Hamadaea sp. NPDC050747 TaxID=3155789 RepID=UPI0033F4338E
MALDVSDAHVTKVGSVSQAGDQQVRLWLNVTNHGNDDATSCVARSDLGGGLASAPADIHAGTTVTFTLEGLEHANPEALRHETDFHVWAACGSVDSGKESLNLVIEGVAS